MGKQIWFFQGNFQKISIFRGKNFNFSRKIGKIFWFIQANCRKKILIFPGKLMKNFDFSGKNFRMISFLIIYSKTSVYPDKICRLQLNSRQIILFRLKSHHFQTYFLYMIRYNNVSRPIHDTPWALCNPTHPEPKIGGSWHPHPSRIDADAFDDLMISCLICWIV